jgi:3',5'-nucleoside bisphosphate phosphatase
MEGFCMGKVDLHVHTTASDGLFSPAGVVQLAEEAGLKGIAITDHDTVEGIEEARAEGRKRGIELVPGVEISTMWQGKEIHMLGYHIDMYDNRLLKILKKQQEARHQRNLKIIDRLNELGIPVTYEEVIAKKKRNARKNPGRPHIAEVLIDKGVVKTMDEAFDQYLGKDGKAYAVVERISPFEAIECIHQSGGAAVIAHPGLYEQDDLIPLLVEKGLDGIEMNHPDHPADQKRHYEELADQLGVLKTAGSDFHGERNGSMYHAPLGTCTTDISVIKDLKKHRLYL